MTIRRSLLFLPFLIAPPASVVGGEDFVATEAEIQAWVRADANKDGVLDAREFPKFIKGMAKAGQSTAELVYLFGAYETAFAVADSDGDGRVTPQELRSADDAYKDDAER